MKSGNKRLITAAFIVTLVIIAAFFLLTGERRKDNEETANTQKGPQPSAYTVTISEESQKTGGITTAALKPGSYKRQITAYGSVLPPDGLNASRKSYIAAAAGLEKAEAQLKASEQEYERLKVLNANDKNVSDRALQGAAARLAADKAEEAHARGGLQSAKDEIGLKWGPILSGWIFDYSAPLLRLLGTKDVLVQVTVPPASPIQGITKDIVIEPPAGSSIPARFVSRATGTDPRLQGISFIYIASSSSGSLVPGMEVTAQMPTAQAQTGFLVPFSAVVWLQDKAWVYIKKTGTGFSRVEVPTSTQVNEDYFVSGIFSPGDELVVKGAQALLSEENTPKAKSGGGEEEEGDED
ncbi:MAG: hypothetical protein M0Z60_07990 [Nitrospiraceae bacterium]|nr:hypothetical protein [Nitrospiraceae bacterium]